MKLIDKQRKHPAFDVASGLAEALLATGTVEVYVVPTFNVGGVGKHPTTHATTFVAVKGRVVEDVQFQPEIHYSCDTCGSGQMTGPNAHNGHVFHRPPNGFVGNVPLDVQKDFLALRKRWEKLKRS